jgi:hypothetical protein
MKVGDLVRWGGKLYIVVRERISLYNLQEVGSDRTSIIDKRLVKIIQQQGDLIIISKSLNKIK